MLFLKQIHLAHLGFAFLTILFTVRCLVLLRHSAVFYQNVVECIIQLVQSLPLDEEPALQLLRKHPQPQICIYNPLFAITKDRMRQ